MTWVRKVLQFLCHVSVYLLAVIEIQHGHQKPKKPIFILQEHQSSYTNPPHPTPFLPHRRMRSPQKRRLMLWNTNVCVPTVEDSESGPSVKRMFSWRGSSVTTKKPRRGNVTGLIDRVPRRLVAPLSKRIWEVICSWREFFLTGFHHQAQINGFVFFLFLCAADWISVEKHVFCIHRCDTCMETKVTLHSRFRITLTVYCEDRTVTSVWKGNFFAV